MLFLNFLCRNNSALSKNNFLLSSFKMSARVCSTSKKSELNVKEGKETEAFKAFYKFPYINFVSSLNKLKVYQTLLTAISIPLCILLEKIEQVPDDTVSLSLITNI